MPRTVVGNKGLASQFAQIAQLLELSGADKFRIIAHDRAARLIEDQPADLLVVARADDAKKQLTSIDGIGAKIADKIIEFAQTGAISERQQLLESVPEGLLAVLEIPGLGPKTVRNLWQTKGVESLANLKCIIDDGSIKDVPRMGAKTIQNIKEAIEFAEKAGDRTPLGKALPMAEAIVETLRTVKGVSQLEYAGSLRRGRETIGDLDILASASDPARVHEAFASLEGVEKVLASGKTKSSVRLEHGSALIQADLRTVPEESYGAALMYFTGSKEHNVRLRERAIKKKLTLNEYGLFPLDDQDTPPHQRGVKALAGATEATVYEALGLPYIPPELRDDRPPEKLLPPEEDGALIELRDIRAELHAHTTASDGSMTIEELALAAKARGFHTIAVTDHSQSSAQAGGLSPDDLLAHIERIRAANEKVKGIEIIAGSEVDIRADGRLDYADEVLAQLDVVVASPHASLRQDSKIATGRLLAAIEHPLVHILGHPTGRLIGRREGLHPDMDRLIRAAVEHDVALEINSHWLRLDLRDTHVRLAREAGAILAIDCDVHGEGDFDNLRYGILTARRGGLTPDACINTWTHGKLHEWLRGKRKRRLH